MDGPLTLNELNVVLLTTVSIMVVLPLTFKLPIILTLFKVDCPDTFNDDINVDEPETIKLLKLVLLFKLFIDHNVDVEKFVKLVVLTYPDKFIDAILLVDV